MQLSIENATRLFSVVGAPYIAESHSDDRCDERRAHARREHETCTSQAGSWLDDGR
ncbi:MAG TPA: hypothetical protein VIU42_15310 [Xanthobacteraceae bacterium]|jgi:hypothetical protein